MFISPEHFELNERYQKLRLKSRTQEKAIEKRDEDYKQLYSKFTPLNNRVDKLSELVQQQGEENKELHKIIKEKDQLLQKYDLLQHQYDQLIRMLHDSRSEKYSGSSPDQLSLGIDGEVIEACSVGDGQRISSYTKYKAEPKKHPGRNQIPAHIPRKYVDMHPDNLPEGAELFGKEETEQLEYDPGKLFATCYRRFKYMLKKPDGSVEFFIAPLPEEKDKNIAAPSLRAHHIVEKYMYHTPSTGNCRSYGSMVL